MAECEEMSKKTDKPAVQIFKEYLALMDKYSDYFFSEPWPEKYDYDLATTFTDEDMAFLDANEDEYEERFVTLCLKKNMSLEGYNWGFGVFWTRQAFHEQFIRPELKPVYEAFVELAKTDKNAREILAKLKEQFEDVDFIHAGLVDMLEAERGASPLDLKVKEILELIHGEEGLPECDQYHCKLLRGKLTWRAKN
jgi:hypothetical protein